MIIRPITSSELPIGAHEDTHIISAQLCEPRSVFLCEGLAMFMEGKWWGADNKA